MASNLRTDTSDWSGHCIAQAVRTQRTATPLDDFQIPPLCLCLRLLGSAGAVSREPLGISTGTGLSGGQLKFPGPGLATRCGNFVCSGSGATVCGVASIIWVREGERRYLRHEKREISSLHYGIGIAKRRASEMNQIKGV